MFWNFHSAKNSNIANNSTTTTGARETISTEVKSLQVYNVLVHIWLYLKKWAILHNNSHRFLVITRLFSDWKNLMMQLKLKKLALGAAEICQFSYCHFCWSKNHKTSQTLKNSVFYNNHLPTKGAKMTQRIQVSS